MIYCFDIDGTLCSNTFGEYEKAKPIKNRIEYVNELYDQGHVIKLLTARGSTTKIDWRKLTESQLIDWGVKYTTLMLGKPEADIYIDDKGLSDKEFFKDSL
tara:strand:+ start:30291 stop:30593 length:303 start_codon:yes stop_codon:yes gene_type:complete